MLFLCPPVTLTTRVSLKKRVLRQNKQQKLNKSSANNRRRKNQTMWLQSKISWTYMSSCKKRKRCWNARNGIVASFLPLIVTHKNRLKNLFVLSSLLLLIIYQMYVTLCFMFCCVLLLLLSVAFIYHYALLSSKLTALTCDSTWVTSIFIVRFWIATEVVYFSASMAGATWNCCYLGAFCVHHITM